MIPKSVRLSAIFLIVAMFATATALAQTPVPPPPKPPMPDSTEPKATDSSPSLEVTMKFIQDGLSGMKVSSSYQGSDGEAKYVTHEFTAVRADAAACTLEWQEQLQLTRATASSGYKLSFKDVAKLQVSSRNAALEKEGSGLLSTPDMYVLTLTAAWGKKFSFHYRMDPAEPKALAKPARPKKNTSNELPKTVDAYNEESEAMLIFQNEEIASRMARAMIHAVDLCGGGDKSPF